MHKRLMWGSKEDGDRFFSVLLGNTVRSNGHKRKYRKSYFIYLFIFYSESGQMLEQVDQKTCRVSIPRGYQSSAAHNTEQPVVADLAWSTDLV